MFDWKRSGTACRRYEARLEDYLTGAHEARSDRELLAHLESCARCRAGLEAAQLSREWLRGGLGPGLEPNPGFGARVLAGIRAEEGRRAAASDFWRLLEVLALRLVVTAALLLLVLAFYEFKFAPPPRAGQASAQTEMTEGFPALTGQPSGQDEVLLSLAENGHGR